MSYFANLYFENHRKKTWARGENYERSIIALAISLCASVLDAQKIFYLWKITLIPPSLYCLLSVFNIILAWAILSLNVL